MKNKKNLKKAEDHEAFWLKDGPVLKDMRELCQALKNMDDSIYNHHAAEDKNDFSCWVKDVLCDTECANDLLKVKDRHEAAKSVEKALEKYQ